MKTDYNFGDKVRVLTKRDDSTDYRNGVVDGIVGFSELFNYDELEFLGESIEND